MNKFENAEEVSELFIMDKALIRRLITIFNAFGLEIGLFRNKYPVDRRLSLQKKN